MAKVGFRVSYIFAGHEWHYEWKNAYEAAEAYAIFLRRMGAEEVFIDPDPTTVQEVTNESRDN